MSEPAAASSADRGPTSIPQTIAPEALKEAFRRHAAGVAVITADVGDGPIAITISSLSSVSADPAIVLCSVASTTETGRAMARAETVVVHLLDGDDLGLAVRCATPGSDRFGDQEIWERLPSGEPSFTAPHIRLRGSIVQREVFGESTILVIAVLEVIERDAAPDEAARSGAANAASSDVKSGALVYHDRAWHVLGARSHVDGPAD